MISLQLFRIVATIFAADYKHFKQLYDRVYITTIRYIFPTIQIVGQIVQMYIDLRNIFWWLYKRRQIFIFNKSRWGRCSLGIKLFIKKSRRKIILRTASKHFIEGASVTCWFKRGAKWVPSRFLIFGRFYSFFFMNSQR